MTRRLWWAGRNVAVRSDGYPLRVDRRRVGLEVTELLLLLIPLAVLLLRRIVRRAYSRSYRLPPQEVDLEELYKEVKD